MKSIFLTPGPSQLYPTCARHVREALRLNVASISHRGDSFHEIFKNTQNHLRILLNIPKIHQIFFVASATEAMERILENTVGKKSFHFVNGAFSNLFFDIAVKLKKKVTKNEVQKGQGFTAVEIPRDAELICVTQNETSTGVATPMEFIYKLKEKHPQKLIALDVVSSAPQVSIDFKLVDLVFFSVQKGFGLPAGLGVLVVSPQAMAKSEYMEKKNLVLGSYHRFRRMYEYGQKLETSETPNVLGIYLLGRVAQDMRKKGIEKIRQETASKAKSLYEFFEWHQKYSLFVQETKFRSETVIVANLSGSNQQLLERLKRRGFIVGNGYKEFKGKQIRIANFPAHSQKDIKRLLEALK